MEHINVMLGIVNGSVATIIALIALPMIYEKIGMNRFYGARFAKSFQSDELWRKINKKAGKLLLIWALAHLAISLSCFLLPPLDETGKLAFSFLSGLYLIPALQAYRYAQSLTSPTA
ncbi:SdpI family protein [Pelagicoccus sp. NFK12]|uniref:SdpI family protein n=1 Tax=Pelagicoccus enzymogenes TaxID=2773457 RepID=A0A927F8E7_9BACT|nr:SdpI family protein [Pelagicoccus enzymogenes]MBD5780368.1 SdpI family protein [Pelagicoccus enzymogenes]